MKKVLLDTSAYSRLLAGDRKVLDELEKASIIYFSVIVIGELLAAFRAGSIERKNREILEKFINKPTVAVINVSFETSDIYADIMYSLKKKSTPIPINDVWIAAHAIETGSKLITFDRRLLNISGLRIWGDLKNKKQD